MAKLPYKIQICISYDKTHYLKVVFFFIVVVNEAGQRWGKEKTRGKKFKRAKINFLLPVFQIKGRIQN